MSEPIQAAFLSGVQVREILASIEAEATREGLRVATAVVDRSGRLMGLQVMAGTLLTSDRVAIGKAFAAATFGEPTRSLAGRIPQETLGQLAAVDGRPCFIVGGLPILRGDLCLGGLGISGGPAAVDERLGVHALSIVLGSVA